MRAVVRTRLVRPIGEARPETLNEIERALRTILGFYDGPGFVALGASKPAAAKLDKKAMRKRWAKQLESKGK